MKHFPWLYVTTRRSNPSSFSGTLPLRWMLHSVGWDPLLRSVSYGIVKATNFGANPKLVGGFPGTWLLFFHSVGNHHPNWRTHILQRGRYTTNQKKHMRLHQLRWVFDDFPGWDTEDTDWRQDVLIQPATVTRALVVFAMVRAVIYQFLFVFSIPQCILWFPSHFLQ